MYSELDNSHLLILPDHFFCMSNSIKNIIAIDFGTTTTAWSYRENNNTSEPVCISPITNEKIDSKTTSDVHCYLNDINDQLTIENTSIGCNALKLKESPCKYHLQFAYYKMEMYSFKGNNKKALTTPNYPSLPTVVPINMQKCERIFTVSEIFKIVAKHTLKSIQQYFSSVNKNFNLDEIMFYLTLPAIATQGHKMFMRQMFGDAVFEHLNKRICEFNVECIEEPCAGFLYALHLNKKDFEQSKQTIAILDLGGGTYDITVARFTGPNIPAEIIFTDFGDDIGGSEVDKKFSADIQNLIHLDDSVSEQQKAIITSNILDQFQKIKHQLLAQDCQDDGLFEIDLKEITNLTNGAQIFDSLQEKINEINKGKDDLEIDIFYNDQQLVIQNTYAIKNYLSDVLVQHINTTSKLIQEIHKLKDENQNPLTIDQAIMLGGFSGNKLLENAIKSQIEKIYMFNTQPSLAIANGATFAGLIAIKQKVKKALGLEILIPLSKLDKQYLDKIKYPFYQKYIDEIKKVSGLGIECVYEQGQDVTANMIYEHKFTPPDQQADCVIDFVVHEFEPNQKCPNIFAHDASAKNAVEAQGHYHFQIKIDNNIPVDQRYITVKFHYSQAGSMMVYFKIGNQDYTEKQIYNQQNITELYTRFKQSEIKHIHTIFCVDISLSMGQPTQLNVNPQLKAQPCLLSDVFQNGIYEYLNRRKQQLGTLENDKFSIILFNHNAVVKCNCQKFENAEDCFNYYQTPCGGTNYKAALKLATQLTLNNNLINNLVFLSDGQNDIDFPLSKQDIQSVKEAFGNQVYFIAFGKGGEQDLNAIAKEFGKQVIKIQNSLELQIEFAKISLPELL